MKPRVFVSSVMADFEACRAAARRAIEACGAEPVMAEDFQPDGTTSRNACLDGVASSDVLLLIIGPRGGWATPSGKLAVEEEYEEARRRHLIICAFVQDVGRDAAAEALVSRISDYVRGHFRMTFTTPEDLAGLIEGKLPPILEPLELPTMSKDEITSRLTDPYSMQNDTTVRLVLAPERFEEVIDRLQIGEPDFSEQMLRIGHDGAVRFFNFSNAKSTEVSGDVLTVEERPQGQGYSEPTRRLEISTNGILTFDHQVSEEERHSWNDMSHMFQLDESSVRRALATMFSYSDAIYLTLDEYWRHQRFTYGIAAVNVGFKTLVKKISPQSGGTMAQNLTGPLVVEGGRLIGRDVLGSSESEVDRIVKLLGRLIPRAT